MKTAIKYFSLLLVVLLLLASCFSPYSGEEEPQTEGMATLTINLNGGRTSRTAAFSALSHTIELQSATDLQVHNVPAGQDKFTARLAFGIWTIRVSAILNGLVYATGTRTIDFQPANASAPVDMLPVWDVTVSPSALNAYYLAGTQQFTGLVNGYTGQSFTWELTDSLGGTGTFLSSIDPNTGILSIDPLDDTLTLTVKATSTLDPAKSGSTTVYFTSVMPNLTGTPTVSGNDWENATLTASIGSVSVLGTATFKWLRNGVEIPMATGTTYVVQDADRLQNITVGVQDSLSVGTVQSAAHPIRSLTGIYTVAHLEAIRTPTANLAKNYILAVANLDLSGIPNWTPIGTTSGTPFTGNFDGNNNTISNLTTSSSNGGMFGYIGTAAEVKDLGLLSASIAGNEVGFYTHSNYGTIDNCYSTGNAAGSNVAGIAAFNYGTVQNCHSTTTLTYSPSSQVYVGGIVGINNAQITDCYAVINIADTGGTLSGYAQHLGGVVGFNNTTSYGRAAVANCYATGTITSRKCIGGVAGYNNNSTIENCYADVNVTSTGNGENAWGAGGVAGVNVGSGLVQNCYSIGNVTGLTTVGGVIGYNGSSGSVNNCYATGIVTGNNTTGGVVGYNRDSGAKAENCVALNPSILRGAAGDSNFKRVVGMNYLGAATSNNYARGNMLVLGVTVTSVNTADTNGADISSTDWGSLAWWTGTAQFSSAIWDFGGLNGTDLPKLLGMPGGLAAQNPVIVL